LAQLEKKNWAGSGSAALAGSNSWSCHNTRPYLMKKKKEKYKRKTMCKKIYEKEHEKKYVRKNI